jgi:hypothetical protein
MTKILIPSFSLRTCFLSFSLLALFLAACAPGTSTSVPTEPSTIQATATVPAAEPTTGTSAEDTAVPTEALPATAVPIATSRGPDLHATDPTTVSLASGGLQLVEFFRFT